MPDNQTSDPVDIRELIKLPLEHWDRPEFKLLPIGHYFGTVVDMDLEGFSSKGTPCWVFYVTPTEPGPNVDKKLLEGLDLSSFEFPSRRFYGVNGGTVWLHPKTMGNARLFFEDMGFPVDQEKSMEECASEMLGRKVLMEIGIDSGNPLNPDGSKKRPDEIRKFNILITLTGDPRTKQT